jgi:DNA (cytosine-5)-methyltransferase 1
MRLLDLFCGAGGAAMGYSRAGFHVTGVDIKPQPRYPFTLVQGDALEYLRAHGHEFDAIHASPPCQRYSTLTPRGRLQDHPDLVAPTRDLLRASGKPYVIENVVGSPLRAPFQLCGTAFGLRLRRHRLFEAPWLPLPNAPPCAHHLLTRSVPVPDKRSRWPNRFTVPVYGHTNYAGELKLRQDAMGIDWMPNVELVLAIPPAYTEWIGKRMLEAIK